ncbi:MAG: STAS domain-containing protein [Candidatus Methanomethylophilaceae archaeon]|nr:STAS domain-containing protein [Candidatus Methanomethylophilaceae archaeon]
MKVDVRKEGDVAYIIPRGNVDYVTAPDLDEAVEREAASARKLVFDMVDVTYLASAGLRSLLNADELMEDKDGVKLVNVSKEVRSVLEMTGFTNVLDIE